MFKSRNQIRCNQTPAMAARSIFISLTRYHTPQSLFLVFSPSPSPSPSPSNFLSEIAEAKTLSSDPSPRRSLQELKFFSKSLVLLTTKNKLMKMARKTILGAEFSGSGSRNAAPRTSSKNGQSKAAKLPSLISVTSLATSASLGASSTPSRSIVSLYHILLVVWLQCSPFVSFGSSKWEKIKESI